MPSSRLTKRLEGKRVVVLGASRGVGREIVRHASAEGAAVLAVARGPEDLGRLSAEVAGVETLALDASLETAPARVLEGLRPDVLVICGGARPALKPLQDLTWDEFSAPWDADVKMSFLFCRHALRTPLAPGSSVILVASGAGLGGSPLSGGYAGAKRTQMFIAGYCQKESTRLGLGIRFACLVPMRLMPETELGHAGVEGYARYLGIQPQEFLACMSNRQTPSDVAEALVKVVSAAVAGKETTFAVSAEGIEPLS